MNVDSSLAFHRPETFLQLSNYAAAVLDAPQDWRIGLAIAGGALALLGASLMRFCAALVGAAFGFAAGGIYARTEHAPFVIVTVGAAVAFSLLGLCLPRIVYGLCVGALTGLFVRTLFVAFELGQYGFEAFAGGVLWSLFLTLVARRFWVVTTSAMLGMAVCVLALAPFVDASRILIICVWVPAFLAGMALQLRLGDIRVPKFLSKKAARGKS